MAGISKHLSSLILVIYYIYAVCELIYYNSP